MSSPDGRWRATTEADEEAETLRIADAASGRRLAVGEVARLWRDDTSSCGPGPSPPPHRNAWERSTNRKKLQRRRARKGRMSTISKLL